jgi:hypothetical protein
LYRSELEVGISDMTLQIAELKKLKQLTKIKRKDTKKSRGDSRIGEKSVDKSKIGSDDVFSTS